MKQVALEDFLKKHRDVSRTIATSKTELLVALFTSFQPITNFTKDLNIADMGVLNATLHKIFEASSLSNGWSNWSSTERLYQELEIEHLRSRGQFIKLCLFYKILKNKSPPYLFNLIPSSSRMHTTRNSNSITPFKLDIISSKILFFISNK